MAAKAKPKKMSSKQMKKTKGGMAIPTDAMLASEVNLKMPKGSMSQPPSMPKLPNLGK